MKSVSGFFVLLLVANLFFTKIAFAKTALIYKGPGSCQTTTTTTGCSEASAAIAKNLGYDVQFVGPEGSDDEDLWKKADLWIQPGGLAREQAKAMKPELLAKIRENVKAGMGYVGFCAGAFMAAEKFGWPIDDQGNWFEARGIHLIPAYGYYFSDYDSEITEDHLAKILEVTWDGQKKFVYWELGPYFAGKEILANKNIEVLAYYPPKKKPNVDKVMSLRSHYGAGKVYVTAVHPEAPQDWRAYYKINDPDGVDNELAASMLRWATKD